jgi:hypothetical protein
MGVQNFGSLFQPLQTKGFIDLEQQTAQMQKGVQHATLLYR